MTQQDVVDMFMTSDATTTKPDTSQRRLTPSWADVSSQDQFGLALPVPHLSGAYHVDRLQMLSDRAIVPGMIVFSPATMVAPPFAHHQLRIDPHHNAIEAQIDELRAFALDEGDTFDETSAARALRFCHDLAADHEPAITLLANGNLRAVWQNAARDQIGIQFFPDGLLQYVMLRDRNGRTLKALGEDVSTSKIRAMVEAQGMIGLWFNGGR